MPGSQRGTCGQKEVMAPYRRRNRRRMLVDVTVATDLIDAQDLLERLEESISVYDRDARFVYLDAAAARPFGRARQELIGKRPWDLAPSGTGPSPCRVALEAVLAGGPRAKVTSFALVRIDIDVV